MRILNKLEARSQKPEVRELPTARHFAALKGVLLASGFWLLASSAHAQDAQTLVSQMKQAEATISLFSDANRQWRNGARVSFGLEAASGMGRAERETRRCSGGR